MEIAQVVSSIKTDSWGGIESVAIESSKALIELGHESAIYASPKPGSTNKSQIESVPIKKLFPCYPYSFRSGKIDIIHWHQGQKMAKIVTKMSSRFNVPYIATLHGGVDSIQSLLGTGYPSISKINPFMRSFYEQASCLLCVGMEEYDIACKVFPNKQIQYFPNGVSIDRFAGGSGETFRSKLNIPIESILILCVSRIDSIKNQLSLIKAFSKVYQKKDNVYLLIIGRITDPDYYQKLLSEVDILGLNDRIVWLKSVNPYMPEHVDAYKAADLFVLPSIHESFGIVILEAWESGIPVIASNVGGISHLVKKEINGLLFNPKDISELASKMLFLLGNKKVSSSLGKSGLLESRTYYSWKSIVKKLETIYTQVVESKSLK